MQKSDALHYHGLIPGLSSWMVEVEPEQHAEQQAFRAANCLLIPDSRLSVCGGGLLEPSHPSCEMLTIKCSRMKRVTKDMDGQS
jgi:hypothetical protein